MQGKQRTDVIHLAVKRWQTVHGLVLVVGLHDAHGEFAAADAVDVGHATAAGGRIALDAVGLAVTVHKAADILAGDIINAGLAAGAYGYKLVIGRLDRGGCGQAGQGSGQGQQQGFDVFHGRLRGCVQAENRLAVHCRQLDSA